MHRHELVDAYAKAVVRERAAWAMMMVVEDAHPALGEVQLHWRRAAREVAWLAAQLSGNGDPGASGQLPQARARRLA